MKLNGRKVSSIFGAALLGLSIVASVLLVPSLGKSETYAITAKDQVSAAEFYKWSPSRWGNSVPEPTVIRNLGASCNYMAGRRCSQGRCLVYVGRNFNPKNNAGTYYTNYSGEPGRCSNLKTSQVNKCNSIAFDSPKNQCYKTVFK